MFVFLRCVYIYRCVYRCATALGFCFTHRYILPIVAMSPGLTCSKWPLYRQQHSGELNFNWDLSSLFLVSFLAWVVSFWTSALKTKGHRLFFPTVFQSNRSGRYYLLESRVLCASVENGLETLGLSHLKSCLCFLTGHSLKEFCSG